MKRSEVKRLAKKLAFAKGMELVMCGDNEDTREFLSVLTVDGDVPQNAEEIVELAIEQALRIEQFLRL